MATLVHNLKNTSDRLAPNNVGSWKKWWQMKTGRSFDKCSCTSCKGNAEVGAHVQKDNGTDKWYIVPLCNSCNVSKKNESFYVDSNDLVALH